MSKCHPTTNALNIKSVTSDEFGNKVLELKIKRTLNKLKKNIPSKYKTTMN